MRKWLYILVPVLVLGLLIGWRVGQEKTEASEQSQQKAARMGAPAVAATAPVELRDIAQIFEATGSVEAPKNVKIAPKLTGRIEYLEVHEGDRVSRGQVLVRIDDSEIEAEVQRQMAAVAEARYRLAQAQLNQNPADVAVSSQIKQQKAAVGSAKADLVQAEATNKADVAEAVAQQQEAQSRINTAKAAVNSARANLVNAEAKHKRAAALLEKGFVSGQHVDDARAALGVQQAALEAAVALEEAARAQERAAQQRLAGTKARGQADVEAARAKLAQANAQLDTAQANSSQTSAYRQSISALKAGVEAAQASLRSAQARRRDTVLTSPLDGYVTGRYADPGAIASPTQPILAVQFMRSVWVAIAVPEEVCTRLQVGQVAKVRFDALPGSVYGASIIQINPSADPESRQYTVRAVVENRENRLKPGMFARVALETDRVPNLVVVPREALHKGGDGTWLTVVGRDRKARRVSVTTGPENTEFVSVSGDVRPGESVVTMSSFPVRDGQTVVSGGRPGGRGRKGSDRR